ncbi:unnamed protein product [Aureobasidium uvarum]|uniref:Uncharacterized protein n=1 Tax=Aureobasidium uvarum TaxID=2773716 RepID=A0A9N8PYL1_9PEZI|nr:unnamed protein product [Aureobasidium uvarum]
MDGPMNGPFGEALGRWMFWVMDRIWPGPSIDPATDPDEFDLPPESEAAKALRGIHEIGNYEDLPFEVRLIIFGHWLKQSRQPPWDISVEMTIPDWVTPEYEETWFQNTKFILPASKFRRPDFYQHDFGARLEANTVNFLARLCGRRNAPQPVTVEVLVDTYGDLRKAQMSIHRLLLVCYYLGDRSDLLNIKILVDTYTNMGCIEANEEIAQPLMTRLQQDCTNMRKFRDGSMTMAQIINYVGVSPLTQPDVIPQPPEVKAAGFMCCATTYTADIYAQGTKTSKTMLTKKCKQLIEDTWRREEEEEGRHIVYSTLLDP